MKAKVQTKKKFRLVVELDDDELALLEEEIDYVIGLRNKEVKAMGLHILPEIYNAIGDDT